MISRDGFSHVEPSWDRRVDPQLDMLLAEIAARVKAGRDVDVEQLALRRLARPPVLITSSAGRSGSRFSAR